MTLKMLLQQREQIFCVTLITKFIDCESKEKLLSGLQHVRNTDLHLKLIDLDPNGGILILFILPLTAKVCRNKNMSFFFFFNLLFLFYFQYKHTISTKY